METGMRMSLLPLFAAILVLFPLTTHSQRFQLPSQRPLCASQYTLANYACTHLPYRQRPPPSPRSPPPSPPSPPPPSPPSPPSPTSNGRHGHRRSHRGHGHHHGHRHREQHHQETPIEAECCKWMQQMDSECVCDLLAHLPPFLARLVHNYTVVIDDSCSVSYVCSGRIFH